ncbi:hypothetical protein FQR65_LT09434 [Abscondita terminalis]|nr:hypothetical protein FQR65_LT09434 [Abscondita terminalis]
MVAVHGGGFIIGAGSKSTHGPDNLMTKDVVVVTFNYRVGLLGFLSFDDPALKIPGNAGMKDQVLALKWIKENIRHFNGDPNNITVFGISAGGASVHYLMLSPLAKGLFHKCIIQSGTAFCPWAQGQKSLPYVAEALGLKNATEREVLKILENMSIDDLLILQDKIPDSFSSSFKRYCAPVVENKSPIAFISENPQDIIRTGNYQQVPFIIGFTSREGSIADTYAEERKNGYITKDFEDKIPYTFNILKGSSESKLVANKIKSFYYGDNEPCKQNNNQFYLLEGDTLFEWPTIKSVKEHIAVSSVPIYLYRLSVDTTLLNPAFTERNFIGVSHGNDMMYVYKTTVMPAIASNTMEEKTMRRFITMWTNFAISGDPNVPQNDALQKIEWKRVNNTKLHYLEIGENLTIGIDPDGYRMDFWDEIYSAQNDKK